MFVRGKSVPIYLQEAIFLKAFIGFKRQKYNREKQIILEGYLQPTPMSKVYRVKIDYNFRVRPSISLPDEDFSKERPPHTFKDGELCLYHKDGSGAWNSKKLMTDLVPMISHWLWCYEVWQVTKIWYGEEYSHDPLENKVAS